MMEDGEISEVVDLVHTLVLQSRPPPGPFEEALASKGIPAKIAVKSVPSSPCNSLPRSKTVPVRKKVQIKSAPLKPPDIGNASLFPSVEEAALLDSVAQRRIPLKSSAFPDSASTTNLSNGASKDLNDSSGPCDWEKEKRFKTLEAKLTGPLGLQEEFSSTSTTNVVRKASLAELTTTTPSRKTPRSAKLFSELSVERRLKLDELAEKYSKSIDKNQCRSILDEFEFLFQLFNSNNASRPASGANHGKVPEVPLLCSAAEQSYFVLKIVITQLDKVFISIPSSVLQLIVENYPHKIPKPVRKHIDDWISEKTFTSTKSAVGNDLIPRDLATTVTFKSEKDGRANFLHQTDFHNFCKQRDLFYSIRDSWTSTGESCGSNSTIGVTGGMIIDRTKARMSFPPVQQHGGSSSRYVDSFPLKVQSLFQMNQNPTNLFHMASLFVSHYLLEARASEVGGVPKDDSMKEFFQSNPLKLVQLNSRFFAAAAETLETESSNFAFQKHFLLASSNKFVQHVVDRLVMEITKAEGSIESADLTNPTHASHVYRCIKDTIHLARILGYSHCLPYLSDDKKHVQAASIDSIEKESVMREQVLFRSYQTAPIDLKFFVDRALKSGRLIASCPWIIEYLLQCDSVSLLLPSYQAVLTVLFQLYRTTLSQNCASTISVANKNFLRFYFGMLFSSKNFPDTVFVQLRNAELCKENKPEHYQDNGTQDVAILDSLDDLGRILIEFSFEEAFNRFKRILSWGKLEVSNSAITGDFRHIRPIPASGKSTNAPASSSKLVSKDKAIQMQLETTFFDLYPPSVKRSVEFVSERMAFNFITVAKAQLFPNMRNFLTNQGVFGVRAAERCRTKLGEEMNKYLTEKCAMTVKMFLEHSVTTGVLSLCQCVTIRKAKEAGYEWIHNYISAGMFPNVLDDRGLEHNKAAALLAQCQMQEPSGIVVATPTAINEAEEPPFEILILIHRTLRKLQSGEKIDVHLIDKVLLCQTFSKSPWAFIPLFDWGMSLITYQPQSLTSTRMRQLVALWKELWAANANILNSRNIMILAKSTNSRDSWIKLGSVTQLLISEGIMKATSLEENCFALLCEDWPDEIHKRISEYLTIVLEAFQERAEWNRNSESAQVLDWVAWLCSGQPDQD